MQLKPLGFVAPGRGRERTGFLVGVVTAAGVLALAAPPASANNILPSAWDVMTITGSTGTLRAGSPWAPAPPAAFPTTMLDGVFLPETTQWNSGSFWWDQDPTVNPVPVVITVYLDQVYTIYGLTIQADNNDNYRAEFWDGGAWQVAWDASPVAGWGLMTRTSGTLPGGIMTDRLQFTAFGGDNYFAISEIQASNVPEPTTLALLGAGLVALRARRRRHA